MLPNIRKFHLRQKRTNNASETDQASNQSINRVNQMSTSKKNGMGDFDFQIIFWASSTPTGNCNRMPTLHRRPVLVVHVHCLRGSCRSHLPGVNWCGSLSVPKQRSRKAISNPTQLIDWLLKTFILSIYYEIIVNSETSTTSYRQIRAKLQSTKAMKILKRNNLPIVNHHKKSAADSAWMWVV